MGWRRFAGTKKISPKQMQWADFDGFLGSPTRARTWDLRINSPSLYRLSYRGPEKKNIACIFRNVQAFVGGNYQIVCTLMLFSGWLGEVLAWIEPRCSISLQAHSSAFGVL